MKEGHDGDDSDAPITDGKGHLGEDREERS